MRKIIIFTGLLVILFTFYKCQKEDIFDRFYPEILFMKAVVSGGGTQTWTVDPDFKEVSLSGEISEYLIKARVSAPNKLTQIQLINESAGNAILQTITDFEQNSNVRQIEFLVSNISATTNISIQATDMKGNVTKRVFTIQKN